MKPSVYIENKTPSKESGGFVLDLGFDRVTFEETHGKHTYFDKYHSFKQARRVAEWRSKFAICWASWQMRWLADSAITFRNYRISCGLLLTLTTTRRRMSNTLK